MRVSDRITRLETAVEATEAVLVWRQIGETAEEAVARYRREKPGERERPITVIGWLDSAEGEG